MIAVSSILLVRCRHCWRHECKGKSDFQVHKSVVGDREYIFFPVHKNDPHPFLYSMNKCLNITYQRFKLLCYNGNKYFIKLADPRWVSRRSGNVRVDGSHPITICRTIIDIYLSVNTSYQSEYSM